MNKKGFVLLHVIVLALIVASVTAGLARMLLMNYTATQRAVKGGQNRKEADALLSRATSYWSATGTVCANIPGIGACAPAPSPAPGVCNCSCPAAGVPRVWARVVGGECRVDLISSDPP
jgi:hypothetical protein